jgi:hypothetical protein
MSERRNTLSKLEHAKLNSKWATKPDRNEPTISQRQRDLWDALNNFCMERGAAIVSVKYANPARIEIPVDSPLADKLCEAGFDPIFCEQTTRIGPAVEHALRGWRSNRNSAYSFHTVDIFTVKLPK